ncbi:minor capsid protein [Spirillospora sp. NBC_00431]
MAWTNDLLTGLAEHLAANGVASWYPTGAFPVAPPLPPVALRSLPDEPDRAYSLDAYAEVDTEDAGLSDVTTAVQLQSRGKDPGDCDDVADAVWEVLHGARMLTLGSGAAAVYVSLIYRRSTARLGTDGHGRYERSCNYYVLASRPNSHRPD